MSSFESKTEIILTWEDFGTFSDPEQKFQGKPSIQEEGLTLLLYLCNYLSQGGGMEEFCREFTDVNIIQKQPLNPHIHYVLRQWMLNKTVSDC